MQLQCIGSLVVTAMEQRLSTESPFIGLSAKKQRYTSDLCQTGGYKRRRHKLWNKVCHSLLKKPIFTVQMFHSWTCSAAWIRCVRNGFKQAKTESFKCKYQISWTKKSMFYRCESKTNIFVPSCSFEICLKPCFQRLCQRLWRKRLRTGGQEVSEIELSGLKVLKKVTGLVLSFSSFYTQDQIWLTRTI